MYIKVIILTLEKYSRIENINKLIDLLHPYFIIEIFYGIDGSKIEIKDSQKYDYIKLISYEGMYKLYNKKVRMNGQEMRKGEFGTSWSHLSIYEKLLNDKLYDSYLIFEDDAQFIGEIKYFLKSIEQIPKNFDAVHLGVSDHFPFQKKESLNNYFYIPEKLFFNRLTSYIITKTGAKKLLDMTLNFINIPADDLLSITYVNTDFNLNVPNIWFFSHNNEQFSSIIDKINSEL